MLIPSQVLNQVLLSCRQVAFNPRILLPLSHLGEQDEFRVQDASSFTAIGEALSYWELLVRGAVFLGVFGNTERQSLHMQSRCSSWTGPADRGNL